MKFLKSKNKSRKTNFLLCHIRLDENFYYYWCCFEKYEENIRCCIRVHKINLELYFQDLSFKYFLEQRFENTFHRKKFVNYTNLQHMKTKSFQTSIKNHELVSWEDLKNAHFFASHKVKSNLSSIIFNFWEY